MTRGLDTYTGRSIVRMETDSDDNWFVELDGEVRIINTDGRRTLPNLPNGGVGMQFRTVIMDENQTQMIVFDGVEEYRIPFTPTQYQIYDSTQGAAWSPQTEPDLLETPPHPDERVAEGPSEEWLEAQQAIDEASEETTDDEE